MPYINMRNVYEIRERPSRMYKWTALVTSQLLAEIPWNIVGSSLLFLTLYWLVGIDISRAGYTYLMIGVMFPLYYMTLALVSYLVGCIFLLGLNQFKGCRSDGSQSGDCCDLIRSFLCFRDHLVRENLFDIRTRENSFNQQQRCFETIQSARMVAVDVSCVALYVPARGCHCSRYLIIICNVVVLRSRLL